VKTSSIVIVGGGLIGLSTAYFCSRRGHRVVVLERQSPPRDGCSFDNAGLVVPSHFIPLAAPGMVTLALRWMGNPESPFYLEPRWSWDLIGWAWRFCRAATAGRVAQAAPLLRELNLASRALFEELASREGNRFGFTRKGLLMLCRTERALHDEAKTVEQARRLGLAAELLTARQAAELEPNVHMTIAGAAFFPDDCHLSPRDFVLGLEGNGRPPSPRRGGPCAHAKPPGAHP